MLVHIDIESLYISTIYHCNKNENTADDFKVYKDTFKEWFETILKETNATEYLAFDDAKPSFRHALFNTFKSDRQAKYFKFINDLKLWARLSFSIKQCKGLEADDLVSISNTINEGVICHIDSDINQISGKHYNYHYRAKGWANGFYDIDESDALYNMYKTVLKGGHNNTKGLDNCGEKTIEEYFSNLKPHQYFGKTISAFMNGLDKKDGVSRNVKGLGLIKGLNEFTNNINSVKLLKTIEEANYWLEKFNFEKLTPDLFTPIKTTINEHTTKW